VRNAIQPLMLTPYGRDDRHGIHPRTPGTALRIRSEADTVVRATVTVPYADGGGTRDDTTWASIHASPPWVDTDRPAIIEHIYGRGTAIYCAGDLEVGAGSPDNEGPRSLFVELILSLLPSQPRVELVADPGVWAVAFDDQQGRRMRLNLSNEPGLMAVRPVPSIRFRLNPPPGETFRSLEHRPEDGTLDYRVDAGAIEGEIRGLRHFISLEASYERVESAATMDD
jgi:hypothetical protein